MIICNSHATVDEVVTGWIDEFCKMQAHIETAGNQLKRASEIWEVVPDQVFVDGEQHCRHALFWASKLSTPAERGEFLDTVSTAWEDSGDLQISSRLYDLADDFFGDDEG